MIFWLSVTETPSETLCCAVAMAGMYLDRVFVSEGNVLWRKRIVGSGSNGRCKSGYFAALLAAYDTWAQTDGLRLNPAGYQKLADSVDLTLFTK